MATQPYLPVLALSLALGGCGDADADTDTTPNATDSGVGDSIGGSLDAHSQPGPDATQVDGPTPYDASQTDTSSGTCESVTQHGITWHFASAVPCGQFAGGDYWVVGPVTISSIDPSPTNQRNGFDINPIGGDCCPVPNVFDGRASGFDQATYDAMSSSLPRIVQPPASIVSTISNPEEFACQHDGHDGWYNYRGVCVFGYVKTAAVLTVLGSSPPDGSLRPPYAGSDKPMHNISEIQWDLLLNLAREPEAPDINELTETLGYLRVDMKSDSAFDQVYPIDTIAGSSGSTYGAQLVMAGGEIGLTLLSDYTLDQKRLLMIRFLQHGIDQFGALKNGARWVADGGLMSGRKFPIVWAAHFLNDAEMKQVATILYDSVDPFAESCQTYYDDDSAVPYYHGVLGMPRWGIGACHTADEGAHDESNSYRLCCNSLSWLGQTLAMRLLGIESIWGNQATFDYEDRYAQTEFPNGGHGSNWSNAMWTRYRPTIDTCSNGVQDRCATLCNPATGIVSGETGVDCGGPCPACP